MTLKHIALAASILTPLVFLAPGVSADDKHDHHHEHHGHEHRQHGAHVHGIAMLNLALEGDDVHIELDSPAANIVGFEHAPSSDADHAALDKAVATLRKGNQLFRFNEEASCRMEKSMVESELLDAGHPAHGEEHADHHGHEQHGHKEHEHDQHGHETHQGEQAHSDIVAVYHFECDQPGKLTQLAVELFEAFPATEQLKVQYVIESRQGAQNLTPKSHVVKF